MQDEKVFFGHERVEKDEKTRRVGRIFSSVARRYDLMNDLMSGGLHRLWKNHMMAQLNPQPEECLIDVAGGTGDIARSFLYHAQKKQIRQGRDSIESARAYIVDINAQMLLASQTQKMPQKIENRLFQICGNAECLPLRDGIADALTISFGIRNVADIPAALAEFRRVLKPGGRFFCLEFSQMDNALLQRLYDAYSYRMIPPIGEWVTGDRAAYTYLLDSIRRFPNKQSFGQIIEDAGFRDMRITTYMGGAVVLHSTWAV